nr:hypothetical protein [Glycomyces dulcitolivorans]
MGGVGGEAALRGERGFEAAQEVVDGVGEVGDLVAGAGQGQAAVEALGGDLAGDGGDAPQRAQDPLRQEAPDQERDDDHEGERAGAGEEDLPGVALVGLGELPLEGGDLLDRGGGPLAGGRLGVGVVAAGDDEHEDEERRAAEEERGAVQDREPRPRLEPEHVPQHARAGITAV